jgi:hypothetical protein
LHARVAALEARCAESDRLVVDLARKLQDKDRPSTAPRSQDSTAPAPAKKPSGRKPGGQPGHPPHRKQLLPPERVTQTVLLLPSHGEHCQAPLPVERGPEDPEPTRFQVAELPDLKAKVTEYQRHSRTCPCCGQVSQAAFPENFPTHSVAPGLAAVMTYFVGGCGLSKRRVEEVVETVFEVPVALGTVANLEQEMSAALAPAHQQALAAVQQAPVKHLDETGWQKAGHKRWLWVAATTHVVMPRPCITTNEVGDRCPRSRTLGRVTLSSAGQTTLLTALPWQGPGVVGNATAPSGAEPVPAARTRLRENQLTPFQVRHRFLERCPLLRRPFGVLGNGPRDLPGGTVKGLQLIQRLQNAVLPSAQRRIGVRVHSGTSTY